VKAVVIDMDGTITQFNLNFMDARRKILQELDRMNLRTQEMNEQVPGYAIIKMLRKSLDPKEFNSVREKVYKILEDMETDAASKVAVYPGAPEAIKRLRARLLKIGIVTNNGRRGTEMTLRRLNLSGLFDTIVTRDDHEEMKPDPGPVLKVIENLRATAEESVLVGDGVMDVLAAKSAGLRSVAVSTGPFDLQRILKVEPDYLIGSINDLPDLIEFLDPP